MPFTKIRSCSGRENFLREHVKEVYHKKAQFFRRKVAMTSFTSYQRRPEDGVHLGPFAVNATPLFIYSRPNVFQLISSLIQSFVGASRFGASRPRGTKLINQNDQSNLVVPRSFSSHPSSGSSSRSPPSDSEVLTIFMPSDDVVRAGSFYVRFFDILAVVNKVITNALIICSGRNSWE